MDRNYGDLNSEPPDQLLRENRPDAFDQAAAEVPLDPLSRGRRHGLHGRRLELQPVFLVLDPPALRAQPFPGGHRRQRAYDRCLIIPLPACSHAQDTEAAFVVVEGDPLDQAGDFLCRGPAFRDCGIHVWGFIFAWAVRSMPTKAAGSDYKCLAASVESRMRMTKRKAKS